MENQKNENKTPQNNPDTAGRNANDDFNNEQVDDYGVDKDSADAEKELEEREAIKSGRGSQSGDRNRNDDFEQ
jgi:hypothetical protein